MSRNNSENLIELMVAATTIVIGGLIVAAQHQATTNLTPNYRYIIIGLLIFWAALAAATGYVWRRSRAATPGHTSAALPHSALRSAVPFLAAWPGHPLTFSRPR
jgi:hypothetical protein